MSCPKCEPDANSKRWLWWVGALLLLSAVGWFESSRAEKPARPQADSQPVENSQEK